MMASLMMLAAVMASSQDIYPFNTDPCRPCQCSAAGDLEGCTFDGVELRLWARGITRVVPGALRNESLPNVETIDLSGNAITNLEKGSIVDLPKLKVINIFANRAKTTNWFFEVFLPHMRGFTTTDFGLSKIEEGAITNNPRLEKVKLGRNSFTSTEDFGGILTEWPELDVDLGGNKGGCIFNEDIFTIACE